MFSLADPILGEEEKQALAAVIDSGWITMSERVRAFEVAFAKLHGGPDAVAVSSCTAGLHLSLAALGVGAGDEVLVPSLTFVATVNAVLYVGAVPVFVDIHALDRPHMAISDAKQKCTNRTRAVIVMHYGGYPVDLGAWRAFSEKSEISLVEDAAHAPGIPPVGRIGDAAVFSFFSNKNMTTAEGGMIMAQDPELLRSVRSMRSHGMTSSTLDRHVGHAYSYDVTMLGYNYRMDELRAAIGLVQLERLEQWNAKRRELTGYYRRLLGDSCPQVTIPFVNEAKTAGHLLPILLPEDVDRARVMRGLRVAGVQSSMHYPPVHRFSYYRQHFPHVVLPITEQYCQREITLPLHPGLEEEDVERITKTLVDILRSSG